MATHFWLLPWFAVFAGAASLVLGVAALRAPAHDAPAAPRGLPRFPRSLLALWLVAIAAATLGSLRAGAAAGVDVVAARGLLLGALGGAIIVFASRWAARSGPGASPAPLLFGLGTLLVTAGRLWLTHGEISGLVSLALGAALSVLCLGVAPALLPAAAVSEEHPAGTDAAYTSVLALLYVVCLAATAALGFTRASALRQVYWADLPLLLGGALSLGASAGAGLARRAGGRRAARLVVPSLLAALVVIVPLCRMARSWRPAELLGLGILLFGLLALLSVTGRDDASAVAAEPEGVPDPPPADVLGPLVGFVLIVAGCAPAFGLWSGYGLGLYLLGGWFVAGALLLEPGTARRGAATAGEALVPAAAFGFASVLLVYRLAILQSGPAVRASGPGDTWDLLAISLGALLPLAAAEWARRDGLASWLPGWAVTLQWLISLLLPAAVLAYVWQPRSLAGVLLGAALGQLLSGLAGGGNGDARRRFAAVALSGVLLALALFQFLPALQEASAGATRYVRVGLALACAVLVAARLLVPARLARRASA